MCKRTSDGVSPVEDSFKKAKLESAHWAGPGTGPAVCQGRGHSASPWVGGVIRSFSLNPKKKHFRLTKILMKVAIAERDLKFSKFESWVLTDGKVFVVY